MGRFRPVKATDADIRGRLCDAGNRGSGGRLQARFEGVEREERDGGSARRDAARQSRRQQHLARPLLLAALRRRRPCNRSKDEYEAKL